MPLAEGETRPCGFCGMTITGILHGLSGKVVPAQRVQELYDVVDGKLVSAHHSDSGWYVSHFETCPKYVATNKES